MRRLLIAGLAVLLAGGIYLYLVEVRQPPIADPDCPPGVPVFTATIPTSEIRHWDVVGIDTKGTMTKLTRDHASFDAEVSPDGRRIVFTTGRDGAWSETSAFHTTSLYIMNTDGTAQRRLVPGKDFSDPTWSPDGEQIAFTGRDPKTKTEGLFVVRPDGTGLRNVHDAFHGQNVLDPAWSPDGQRIAFVSDSESAGSIEVLDLDEGFPEPISSFHADYSDLDWHPTEDVLVFNVLGSNPTNGIYTLDLEEGSLELVFANGQTPAWSPEGDRIAYFSGRGEGPYFLSVRDADGDDMTRITETYGFDDALTDVHWTSCVRGAFPG